MRRQSVPSSTSPSGVVLRSLLADVVDLYEVNRKECARILFDFARWCRVGTFVGKSVEPTLGLCGDAEDEWQVVDGDVRGGWSLDETLVEVSRRDRKPTWSLANKIYRRHADGLVYCFAAARAPSHWPILQLLAARNSHAQSSNRSARHRQKRAQGLWCHAHRSSGWRSDTPFR